MDINGSKWIRDRVVYSVYDDGSTGRNSWFDPVADQSRVINQSEPEASAVAGDGKRGKSHVNIRGIGFGFASDWLKTHHTCSDWLGHMQGSQLNP